MRKIIFLDVDGTLVDYCNRLPDSAVQAVRAARKNGHKVYICTGRSRSEVYDNIWDIGLDGMIGGNGNYVEDAGEVLMHHCIDAAECRHIVDWLNARGLAFYLESNSGLYGSETFIEEARDSIRKYAGMKGAENADSLEVTNVFPTMLFGENLYRDDVNKVSFLLKSYQDHLDSIKEFSDLTAGTWGGRGEEALFGDLGVKDTDKAYAIKVLLQHLGASTDDTIAVGDATVDIPMLAYCNIGIAMGNGSKEIREMADYVTDDVEQDGLYKAFDHFHLI